jgi:uncharacterized protein
MEFFLCVIGMVFIFEGLPYFGFPEKMRQYMQMMQEQDDLTLRIIGGLLVVTGLVIIFLARNSLTQI